MTKKIDNIKNKIMENIEIEILPVTGNLRFSKNNKLILEIIDEKNEKQLIKIIESNREIKLLLGDNILCGWFIVYS